MEGEGQVTMTAVTADSHDLPTVTYAVTYGLPAVNRAVNKAVIVGILALFCSSIGMNHIPKYMYVYIYVFINK